MQYGPSQMLEIGKLFLNGCYYPAMYSSSYWKLEKYLIEKGSFLIYFQPPPFMAIFAS